MNANHHSKGLHHRDWLHAPKAAGRVQPSGLLSDPVLHFARRCCPKALRPIRSVLPQIVGELGRIKTYSSANCSALQRLELTRQMRRYSRRAPNAGLQTRGKDWAGQAPGRECVVTRETPLKSLGYFAVLPTFYGGRSQSTRGGVSVRGSRSILRGFQKTGSNFLDLGTPLSA
jgi:hypothetical protein